MCKERVTAALILMMGVFFNWNAGKHNSGMSIRINIFIVKYILDKAVITLILILLMSTSFANVSIYQE